MSVHHRVVHKRRETITCLPLYYSGHLLKKLSKERDFERYYGELRGATLFLYKDDTQDTYTEMLDLEQLKSMELDTPYQQKTPTIFTLILPTEEVQLKMDDADTGEEWRGYILTVVRKEIPAKLQLLPGQMCLLQDILAQERKRNSASGGVSSTANTDKPAFEMPECFFDVTRQEAEQMLEANPEYGGIILRPSAIANSYALTLRQPTPRGAVMKNYRVAATKSGFVIELEKPVTISTLNDAVKYFVEKNENILRPYMLSQLYDTRIEVTPTPPSVSINSPADRIRLPRAQVAPALLPQPKPQVLPRPDTPGDDE
ncbi:signal-transducing adaptor protein 1-like [Mugil cephalus]|uniref:signal-transducing adaptor protein 1-like n=1 Tax=Mugil cephalus TaxID=48193 RepID=UPI001FB74E33|nr:signal-transducing adaptor protein 1-like [Mugil cephalus]XP_047440998.1 signal-transducing adaptor protein 1-like [Mugil cephalus]